MIKAKLENSIYEIRFERPEARNALNKEARQALRDAFENAPKDARVVLWRGVPEAFCSGQDLQEFNPESDVEAIIRDEYMPIIAAIEALDVPLIAAVEGACAGAGVSLALAADIVVAKASSFFQIAFSRIGLVPDILLTHQLPRLVGTARAQGLALTGERLPAPQAENWGMIWRAIADDEFEAELDALITAFSKGASFALGRTRKLMRHSWQSDPDHQLGLETKAQIEASQSDDFKEGVEAFKEKRPPKFEGR